ncbi:hypothetical protein DL93DRAFT_2092327 [Clavulina sp. PMI_390]|nr:hypothetical protein DL93DRAFT_2092327 [Clavulina sp. PMI_390]
MEGEVADDYIDVIHDATVSKLEPGDTRLLLVDGHPSHFSKLFTNRAVAHRIVILVTRPLHAYPPRP